MSAGSKTSLPMGWTETRLADVAQVRLGRQRSPAQATGPHMKRYVRAGNITWGGLDLSDVKEMNFSPKEQDVYRLRAGDILLSEASGSPGEVGKPAIWNEELPECYFQNTVIRVRPPAGITKFLFFQLLRDVLAGRFIDHSKGVGINHLGSERLSELTVRIAPEPQRAQIVEHLEVQLSRIESGVQALQCAAARVDLYRASVLKAACEGRLVPTEAALARRSGRDYEPADRLLASILEKRSARLAVERHAKADGRGRSSGKHDVPAGPETSALPALPDGWCWSTLNQLTNLITSGSRGWGDRYSPVGPLFIRAQDIKSDALRLEDVARVNLAGVEEGTRTRVYRSDLLVTITGANVTKTALVSREIEEAYVSQHVALVRPVDTGVSAYIHRWIVSPANGRRSLEKAAYGAGKPGLNLDNLRELAIALPPRSEQERIVAAIDRLMSLADGADSAIQVQLARAKQLKRAVLQDAFEGRLFAEQTPSSSSRRPPMSRVELGAHLQALEGTT